jgi:uncharacterized protein YutE (UPF0331/DUF86 family)
VTKVAVARKVAEVLAHVARVRELLPRTVEQFLSERTAAEALILNLYLSLQGCSDLAMHVVADRGVGVPADARGAFELLGRNGVVAPELARRLAAAVGLRNRIAHEYGALDLKRVYELVRDELGDLESFASTIATAYSL